MEKTSQSSTSELSSLYMHSNAVKKRPTLLDKASRYFEREIAQKYGYKIINFIDVKGTRFVIAEKNNHLYIIALIITLNYVIKKLIGSDFYNSLRDLTKKIASIIEAIAGYIIISLE